MKLYVNKGRGYVTAEENEKLKLPKGTLYLDSYHSPIREIRYEVENARVDQRTDYDRLIFEIWTSGTISPQDSLARAAWVLRKQLDFSSILMKTFQQFPCIAKKLMILCHCPQTCIVL